MLVCKVQKCLWDAAHSSLRHVTHSNEKTICFRRLRRKQLFVWFLRSNLFRLGNGTHSNLRRGTSSVWIFNGGVWCNLDALQPYINYLCVEGAKQPRCIPSLTPLSCGSQLQQSPPPPPPPFVCIYSTSCAHTHPNQQLEMRFSQVHNPIVLLSWD